MFQGGFPIHPFLSADITEKMELKSIVLTRHGDIRSGWRLLLFLVVATLLFVMLSIPYRALGTRIELLGQAIVLIAVLAASFIMTKFINRKPFGAIGLLLHPGSAKDFGLGTLVGFLMMTAIFLVEYPLGYAGCQWKNVALLEVPGTLGYALVLFGVSALSEEVLFRGYLFQTLMQAITFIPAILLMALLFAAAHAANPNASTFGLVNVALAAIWLSFAYMKTRSLWLPFGLHFGWNFTQTSVYGFPTSGYEFAHLKLFVVTQSGPEWLTGGAFGPEGGALATCVLVAGTWYLLKSKLFTAPEGIVTLDSMEDLLPPDTAAGHTVDVQEPKEEER